MQRVHHQCRGLYETNWVKNRQRMERWLRSQVKPVAVMCTYQLRGQEIAWACQRLGLSVPEDVALVGVGGDEVVSQICSPPLSNVATNGQQVGYESAKLLHKLIRGGRSPAGPILVPPDALVVRQSSDIVAVQDAQVAAALRFIREHAEEPIAVKDILRAVPNLQKYDKPTIQERYRPIGQAGDQPHPPRACQGSAGRDGLIHTYSRPQIGLSRPRKCSSKIFHRQMHMTPTQYRRSRRLPGVW